MEGDDNQAIMVRRIDISIHSLRVEGDESWQKSSSKTAYFNPLPPCGGRLTVDSVNFCGKRISIHSLRVEGDSIHIGGVIL